MLSFEWGKQWARPLKKAYKVLEHKTNENKVLLLISMKLYVLDESTLKNYVLPNLINQNVLIPLLFYSELSVLEYVVYQYL